MVYSTYTDVRRVMKLAATEGPSNADITSFIEESDAYINKVLGPQDNSDALIGELSALLTAIKIVNPDPFRIRAEAMLDVTAFPSFEWQRRADEIKKLYGFGVAFMI